MIKVPYLLVNLVASQVEMNDNTDTNTHTHTMRVRHLMEIYPGMSPNINNLIN